MKRKMPWIWLASAIGAIWWLAHGKPGEAESPLVTAYLSEIASAVTTTQLDDILARMDADYRAGNLTGDQWIRIYDAWWTKYDSLVPY